MFTFDKEKLNKIDQHSKYIVYGFLRDPQKALSIMHETYVIPELVFYICLCYYYQDEYFTKHGINLQLNSEQNMVSYSYIYKGDDIDMNTVYGNIEILYNKNTGIDEYIWIFEVIKCSETISIGIDSSNNYEKSINDAFYDCGSGPSYAHEFVFDFQRVYRKK